MRKFIILCLAALTIAAPQGYNYASQPFNQYFKAATINGATFDGHNEPEPIISKHFFIHSAPEEEAEFEQKNIILGQPRKNFNVVFIKSPVEAKQKTKIRLIPAPNEDKTVIYVLAKKADEHDVIAQVEEPLTTTAKPEVYFIKYRTNEEAEHAQNTIKAEYDYLGGSSVTSNEGTASVSSVIGSLEANAYGSSDGAAALLGHDAANAAYLPPVRKQ